MKVAERERVELRVDSAWLERVRKQAERLQMNLSTYIRMVVTERMEQDEEKEIVHE